jgi:excisionase family DNA binding protein
MTEPCQTEPREKAIEPGSLATVPVGRDISGRNLALPPEEKVLSMLRVILQRMEQRMEQHQEQLLERMEKFLGASVVKEAYTTEEVARLLKVHDKTIHRLIHSGKLNALRVGGRKRITQEQLDRYVEENAVRPKVKRVEPTRRVRREKGQTYKFFDPV